MKNLLIKIICLLFLTSCCCQEKTKFYSKKCLPNNLQNDNKNNNCLLFYKNYELPQYQVQKTIDETICWIKIKIARFCINPQIFINFDKIFPNQETLIN